MFAILHAFILKHEGWSGGVVCVAYDNSSVVDALNEHSIRGTAIGPLQRIAAFSSHVQHSDRCLLDSIGIEHVGGCSISS
jgi:hypothetical protein